MQWFQHQHQRESLADQWMRLALRLGRRDLRMDNLERVPGIVHLSQILLPLRARSQLVLGDIRRHAGGLRQRKSHLLVTPVMSSRTTREALLCAPLAFRYMDKASTGNECL